MIYGMYLSAQGAEAQALRQSVIANNLANASTTGFKRDIPVFKAYFPHDVANQAKGNPPDTINNQTGGLELEATVTDFSQGPLTQTGAPLDVAVMGQGFLQVSNGKETFLSRDGRLALNSQFQLIQANTGLSVMDESGQPIVVPDDMQQLAIGIDGDVKGLTSSGWTPIGQLGLAQPKNLNALTKLGQNLYRTTDRTPAAVGEVQLQQGALEQSGTQPMLSMMEMIETSRAMESNMKMIGHQDEMLGRLLQTMGRK